MTITEFLLARIAEDEENAGKYVGVFPEGDLAPLFRRVLAECAAKRAIIDVAEHGYLSYLAPLAAVYSDHPDYQQKWAL